MKEIPVTFETRASPSDVKDALHEAFREWRESAIPAELRARGVTRARISLRDDRYSIDLLGRTNGRGIALKGQIRATPGRTVVTGTVARQFTARPTAAGAAIVGLWSLAQGDGAPAVLVLFVAAIAAVVGYYQAGTIPDSCEPQARYMIERLKDAIGMAGKRAAVAAPVEDHDDRTPAPLPRR